MPEEMPDYIDLDITKLRIGDSIKVKDVSIAGVTFRENENQILVGVKAKRGAKLDDEAEEEESAEGAAEGAEAPAEGAEAAAE